MQRTKYLRLFAVLGIFVLIVGVIIFLPDIMGMMEGIETVNKAEYLGEQGLKYSMFNEIENTCQVVGIGECTDTDLVIPTINGKYTVVGVYNNAFKGNTQLTRVTLSETVTTVGEHAFSGCSKLEEIVFSENFTSMGSSAFYGCKNLESIDLPKGVKEIPSLAFYWCDQIKSVRFRGGITSIARDAFPTGELKLDALYISDIVAWCGLEFEYYSSNLMYYAENVYLNDVLLEHLVIPDEVTEIKANTFSKCKNLKSVTIPSSIKTIGNGAFDLKQQLETVYINDLSAWCGIEFENYFSTPAIKANEIVIGGKVVTDLVIPDGVKNIGDYAFYGFKIESVTLPEGVGSIGNYAFSHCAGLKSIDIPENVMKIGKGAFSQSGLESVVIPQYVREISDMVFSECKSLKSVTIQNGIESIGRSAFSGCESLESITIPETVISIKHYAFSESGIKSIVIPESVMKIGNGAFSQSGLESVVIPQYVREISDSVFDSCTKLKSVTLQNGIESIGSSAFERCVVLESITLPQTVRSINSFAFSESGIKSIVIPDGVTTIEEYAFANSNLLSIVIPKSVTALGNGIFMGCIRSLSIRFEGTEEQWNSIVQGSLWHIHEMYLNVTFAEE